MFKIEKKTFESLKMNRICFKKYLYVLHRYYINIMYRYNIFLILVNI